MELPNYNALDSDGELDELIISEGLKILAERADDGDEVARRMLEEVCDALLAATGGNCNAEGRPDSPGESRGSNA